MSNEQLEKMFEKLIYNLEIDLAKFIHPLDSEPTSEQKKIIQDATGILENNINGDIKKSAIKIDQDEFKIIENEVSKRLENVIFKPFLKDLDKIVKKWLGLKLQELNNTIILVIPVKEMPFTAGKVTFLTVPRIVWEKDKLEKMTLNNHCIAYIGEIEAIVTRTVLYGKMAKEEPLFAPHIGQLDLAGYKPDLKISPKSEDVRFLYEILQSLERKSTQSQVVRYHVQYERHGEPICDFFMDNEELIKSMKKLTSAIESKRQMSNASIAGVVLPLINSSMVLCMDENHSIKKYEVCFEAILKLSATSYKTPNIKKESMVPAPGLGISTPSIPMQTQPQIPVWTEEDLAEDAKKRSASSSINLPTWSAEELEEEAKKRSGGVNLPMWTEEDLEKDNKQRHSGSSIPEWKEDENLLTCSKCGYSCKPDWNECPVCGTGLKNKIDKEDEASSDKN